MASNTKKGASVTKKGNTFLIRIYLNGKQETIYSGLTVERDAERMAEKVGLLVKARKNGLTIAEAGLAEWVKKLETGNSKIYEKIVSLGLLEQKARPVTLGDICRDYIGRAEKKNEKTQDHYEKTVTRIFRYFGENKPVTEITTDDARSFAKWFRTAPLNQRGKEAKPYSEYTANRELTNVKAVFAYAWKLGRIQLNPFAVVQSGASGDTENKTYVSVTDVLDVINAETTPLKWKVILALGRFAGCRGASDLCCLTWDDVVFSDDGKPGNITLKGKTKPGTIPLAPVLENLLSKWQVEAMLQEVDSQKVFPEINKNTNVSEMTKKSIRKAGKEVWENPWYSLRDSFCIDVYDSVRNQKTYEYYCRHAMKTGFQYYQKMTEHRKKEGAESLRESRLWCDSDSVDTCFALESSQKSAENPVKYDTLDDLERVLKKVLVTPILGYLKGYLQCNVPSISDVRKIKQKINNILENTVEEVFQDTQKNLLAFSCKEV